MSCVIDTETLNKLNEIADGVYEKLHRFYNKNKNRKTRTLLFTCRQTGMELRCGIDDDGDIELYLWETSGIRGNRHNLEPNRYEFIYNDDDFDKIRQKIRKLIRKMYIGRCKNCCRIGYKDLCYDCEFELLKLGDNTEKCCICLEFITTGLHICDDARHLIHFDCGRGLGKCPLCRGC